MAGGGRQGGRGGGKSGGRWRRRFRVGGRSSGRGRGGEKVLVAFLEDMCVEVEGVGVSFKKSLCGGFVFAFHTGDGDCGGVGGKGRRINILDRFGVSNVVAEFPGAFWRAGNDFVVGAAAENG